MRELTGDYNRLADVDGEQFPHDEPENICECCGKPCGSHEVTIDDSFYYEYGDERGVHDAVSVETLSDCCDSDFREGESDD